MILGNKNQERRVTDMGRLTLKTEGSFGNAHHETIFYAPLSGKWYYGPSSEGNTSSPWYVETTYENALERVKYITGYKRGPKSWLNRAKDGYISVSTYDEWDKEETPAYVEEDAPEDEERTYTIETIKSMPQTDKRHGELVLDDSWDDSTGYTASYRSYIYDRETDTWYFNGGRDNNTYHPGDVEVSEERIYEVLAERNIKKTYRKHIIEAVKRGNDITLKHGVDY